MLEARVYMSQHANTKGGVGVMVLLQLRRIGLVVLAAIAVAVFFGMAPEDVAGVYERQIDSALSIAELNEAAAESAVQQQVVNGWVTRDLLEIIARQGADEVILDQRPVALLVIAVLAIAVWGMTAPLPESMPIPIPAPLDVTISDEDDRPELSEDTSAED